MPKKKRPDEKPEDQFKRFVEALRKHDVDESGKPLVDAFKRIGKLSRPKTKRSQG